MTAAREKRAKELARGTSAHYEDPTYYASTYADRADDVRYYAALAALHGGPVLEYGCGSGRIALAIARAGIEVTGVDRSPTMLASFRRALREEAPEVRARVSLRRGDMRSLTLSGRFPLVLCTFNSFLHLYRRSDVERFLARVSAHLTPRGAFVLDVSMPDASELARRPERRYYTPRFRHPTTGELVRYSERFDYDPLDQVLLVQMEFEPVTTPPRRRRASWGTPLAHRQFYPQELESMLHYNGFRVAAIHGDFELARPTRDSATLVFHCRHRRRGSRSAQTPM